MIEVMSFGYKYNDPPTANLVFDMRFLPNPYRNPALRSLNGTDREVQKWLESKAESVDARMVITDFLFSYFAMDTISNLRIAFGCTGGHHRSVAFTEWMAGCIQEWVETNLPKQSVIVTHRDINR